MLLRVRCNRYGIPFTIIHFRHFIFQIILSRLHDLKTIADLEIVSLLYQDQAFILPVFKEYGNEIISPDITAVFVNIGIRSGFVEIEPRRKGTMAGFFQFLQAIRVKRIAGRIAEVPVQFSAIGCNDIGYNW